MANKDDGPVEMLQEEVDEDYEPTDKEIREYAEWLGIDAEEDPDCLWIARRGLMTPLPKPWRPCQSGDGEIFYFNPETGENTWDHPCDDGLRALYVAEREKKAVKAQKKRMRGRRRQPQQFGDGHAISFLCCEHGLGSAAPSAATVHAPT